MLHDVVKEENDDEDDYYYYYDDYYYYHYYDDDIPSLKVTNIAPEKTVVGVSLGQAS